MGSTLSFDIAETTMDNFQALVAEIDILTDCNLQLQQVWLTAADPRFTPLH